MPGGEVIDVEVAAVCPYDELGRRSVEAAVLKAQPLPYAGFESVFIRELTLVSRGMTDARPAVRSFIFATHFTAKLLTSPLHSGIPR